MSGARKWCLRLVAVLGLAAAFILLTHGSSRLSIEHDVLKREL